jgi:hypothetical protein
MHWGDWVPNGECYARAGGRRHYNSVRRLRALYRRVRRQHRVRRTEPPRQALPRVRDDDQPRHALAARAGKSAGRRQP